MNAWEPMRAETHARVLRFLDDLRAAPFAKAVCAVIVCGSAARAEEIVIDGAPQGDIDVMVVTKSSSLRLGRSIGHVVSRHASAGIEGGRVPLHTLERYHTLVNFEAKHTGIVVLGDSSILERIPLDHAGDIARWEAVRLLWNRLFEHLKLSAGLTSPAACSGKTYEALGEAYLVLENRYRASFAHRWRELRDRKPAAVTAEVNEEILRVLDWRLGLAEAPGASPSDALRALFAGLEDVMGHYLGVSRPIAAQLEHLARRESHLSHRLYWLAATAARGRPELRVLRVDPVIALWDDGFRLVSQEIVDPAAARQLIFSWRRCPQIYAATTEP